MNFHSFMSETDPCSRKKSLPMADELLKSSMVCLNTGTDDESVSKNNE